MFLIPEHGNDTQGMSGGEVSRMSTLETKQDALEGRMTKVIETTAANKKALQELQLIFTKYMSRFKDNSDASPSVSKSSVDSDVTVGVQDVQLPVPYELARSKEAAEDDVDNLDFDSVDDIPTQGKTADVAAMKTFTRRPSLAATSALETPASMSFHV